jgi:UDP-N-acetyl-D-glucosamine/UDP-N-acetyl-D-galactosamine dehydrogenase
MKTKTIALIGLGYVGLPLAYHFAKTGFQVIWFDVSERRLAELRSGHDSTEEIGSKISEVTIFYTNSATDLQKADMIIVTVPTPVNEGNDPDYTPLIKASESIGKNLQKWQIIVYESTVDPGATEEICLPILEKESGFKCPEDFKIGYSPERINPGDKEHTVDKILKVISGIDAESLEEIYAVYSTIIKAWLHRASSIMVAEASKIIENTQRDINIAFMNELSIICSKLGINTFDVLDAAGTKWNFLRFSPGLVGWHCIWVDPFYLSKKAQKLHLDPEIILAARKINDSMPEHVAHQVIKMLIQAGKQVKGSSILILWLTFKENVPDFRNSKIAWVIRELREYGVKVEWYDPYSVALHPHILRELYLKDTEVVKNLEEGKYDGVIYAQDHKDFSQIDIPNLLNSDGVIFDIKGKFRHKGFSHYKSL